MPTYALAHAPAVLTVDLRSGVLRSSTESDLAALTPAASVHILFPIIYGALLLGQ